MTGETVKRLARECGFELAGVAAADPTADFASYRDWVEKGFAGQMRIISPTGERTFARIPAICWRAQSRSSASASSTTLRDRTKESRDMHGARIITA